MAVAGSHRGRGIGQALIRRLEEICRERGGAVLEVMTVADIDYYPPYADTRAFYRAIGFEEFYVDAGAKEKYGAEMMYFRKRIEGEPS
jgi:GNAT superfamily N-acetyltransferase